MKGHFERGIELLDRGELDEAESAFREALALDARHAKARINLGVVLHQTGRSAAAAQCYQEALAIDGSLAQGWFNLGTLQLERRRPCEAVESLRRALALDASKAEWHSALAWCLLQSGDAEAAAVAGRDALQIAPGLQEAHSVVLQAMHYIPGMTREQIHAAHLAWGRAQTPAPPHAAASPRDAGRRLRIGYVAPDFCEPGLASFLQPVLSRHDSAGFEVHCYSDARASDPVSWRLRARGVVWRVTAPVPDDQFAQGVREDRIDILVDLAGHGAGGRRLPVFARRPAPIQLSWLGYPGTTGLGAIDYRVTGGKAGADGEERYYTEQLIRMPLTECCYQPEFGAPAVGPLPAAARGGVTFGSFNDAARLTPASLALWMRLLRELPGSRLIVAVPEADQLAPRMAAIARESGIEPQRIVLETLDSTAAALALHAQVDINLDSIPRTGTAAMLHSLWMGVPVVTQEAGSPMEHVRLPDLIARSEKEYLEIAIGLARDLPRLTRLRRELRARLRSSPLLDAAGFTRDLEAAYRRVWHDWCAGKPAHPYRMVSEPPPARSRTPAAAAPAGQRVVVDGVFFQDANTGIARVWRSVLREWTRSGFAARVLLLDREGSAPQIPGMRRRALPRHAHERLEENRAMLQRICDEEQAAVFISTYYSAPLTTPSVMLAHDMIPELFGADLQRAEWREKDACIRGASRIVAVSASTARDLCAFYPQLDADRVTIAHNGVDPLFRPAVAAEIEPFRLKYGVGRPYFLLVGSRATYKNGGAFFRAFARLADRQRYALVCAGGERDLEPEQRQACAGAELHMLRLEDEELRLAYAGAIALVYPSVYEGFGLPVLEALASGCPVITTSCGSLAEVAGDAALCVHPMKIPDIASALGDVQRPELRQALVARGLERATLFSWTKMAQSLAAVLSEVAAGAGTGRASKAS